MELLNFFKKNSQEGSVVILIILGVIVVFSMTIVSGASKFKYSDTQLVGTPDSGINPRSKPVSHFINASLTYNANSTTPILINEITSHETITTPLDAAKAERTNQLYSEYSLQFLDSSNNVLFEKKFDVPNEINTDEGLFGGTGPSTIESDNLNFALSLPVIPGAVSIKIIDSSGNPVTERSLPSEVTSLPAPPAFQTFSGSAVNIAFVSKGYTESEMGLFSSDVQRAKAGIMSIDPYNELSGSINFVEVRTTADLACTTDPNFGTCEFCDQSKINGVLANVGVTADTVMIIRNTPTVDGGCAGIGAGYGFQSNGPRLGAIAAHELQHALIGLYDEYVYSGERGARRETGNFKNCYTGQPPSAEWSGTVTNDSYFQGCDSSFWYRSSETSLMKDTSALYLNPISIRYVKERFGVYTGDNKTDSPTPTNTPKPNSTATPTPTPKPQLDPPGVGWCANDARENPQSINGGSCDVKTEAKWIPPANPYCTDRFKGQADYFFLCEAQNDNNPPTPTQTEVIDNPTCTGPAEGPCKGCKNGVFGYIKPRCGQGDSGDFTLPRQGTYCGASYYDVYLCNDGTQDEFRNPAGDGACNSSPWCIAEATPAEDGAPTPTPANYALECPNDGKHVCASTTSCDGLSGYARKVSGDTICSEYSTGTQPYCCQKP